MHARAEPLQSMSANVFAVCLAHAFPRARSGGRANPAVAMMDEKPRAGSRRFTSP
jgi:hypothetical protein